MNYLDLEDRLYTSTEVAKILGVSLRSVYRYLEDKKLNAEIKTATGRHRFTKQNILDFLSPQNSVSASNMSRNDVASIGSSDRVSRPNLLDGASSRRSTIVEDAEGMDDEEEIVRPIRSTTQKAQAPAVKKMTPIVDDEDEEEDQDLEEEIIEESYTETRVTQETKVEEDDEIDWLAKFRAAAEKYKAEVRETDEPKPAAKVSELTSFSSFDEEDEEVEAPAPSRGSNENYYTSSVGGLKDIAQNLDKSATKASLDYAFTMDAGLSLHKPIKPFSLIHSYVRSEDLPFFEKILGLIKVDKADAQLCLIASDDDEIFSSSRELHGLKVASDSQLKADLISEGKADLAKELN